MLFRSARDSDDNGSKSGSDDVMIKSGIIDHTPGHISGPNSGHISGPTSGLISGPNSGNNQIPILVRPRQKSLTPLMDKVNSNYRDSYQRERGDVNDKNFFIRNESDTISDVINFESHKPHAPLGIREPQGENIRGLQMQKILSSVQNAQLQKEVDALQRQLAQLEELEGLNIKLK